MKAATKRAAPRPKLPTADELSLIERIADRFVAKVIDLGNEPDPDLKPDVIFALARCHANACPLQLQRMVDWTRDFDLLHDVAGIRRHLNYEGGKFVLSDFFLPRFADLKAAR